ncbi:phosphotransferase family protein [Streptomyces sp. NPDC091265]|uniref:phosphotransferase family protein n=1 Tax=unclassified Streptomyces TaxID=2593676 RepID=UPI00344E53ED
MINRAAGEAVGVGTEDEQAWANTLTWVENGLPAGARVVGADRLRGGWTSQMRRLSVAGDGAPGPLVLRSFVKPFFVLHAEGLLTREADVLTLLGDTDVPAASLHGVDATAAHCDHPSLLMSLLPGSVRLSDDGADRRAELLADQLVRIHRVRVTAQNRPRAYQAWTAPERVRVPEATERPELWQRAVDVIRREAPEYQPCFLHRDFHPGNVLFDEEGDAEGFGREGDAVGGDAVGGAEGHALRISGVVDWVETSWGPADLDVAHCSTALALLHGAHSGMRFADAYTAAGGLLTEEPGGHLYWRMLDALAFAPDAEKVAGPWRELGRDDLTPELLTRRLEDYLQELFLRYD